MVTNYFGVVSMSLIVHHLHFVGFTDIKKSSPDNDPHLTFTSAFYSGGDTMFKA